MRIDPDNLTLVDRTAQGLQALELGHRRVRNLILPHATDPGIKASAQSSSCC